MVMEKSMDTRYSESPPVLQDFVGFILSFSLDNRFAGEVSIDCT